MFQVAFLWESNSKLSLSKIKGIIGMFLSGNSRSMLEIGLLVQGELLHIVISVSYFFLIHSPLKPCGRWTQFWILWHQLVVYGVFTVIFLMPVQIQFMVASVHTYFYQSKLIYILRIILKLEFESYVWSTLSLWFTK